MLSVINRIINWIKLDYADVGTGLSPYYITDEEVELLRSSRHELESQGAKFRDGLITYSELYETWKKDAALDYKISLRHGFRNMPNPCEEL